MMCRVFVSAWLLIVSVPGATLAQGKTDSTLDKLVVEFEAAFNAKDAAQLASFYAEDAVLMPPNEPMVKGRTAIQAFWAKQFQQGISGIDLKPIESSIAGGQAFEAGTATVTMSGTNTPTGTGGRDNATDTGKYVVVYRRVGSDWKLAYDIFNSDSAPPK